MSDAFEDARAVAWSESARVDLTVDDPYRELMAAHVEFGGLLAAGVVDAAGEAEYQRLVQHLIDVGREVGEYESQRFAVWMSRITTGCGE